MWPKRLKVWIGAWIRLIDLKKGTPKLFDRKHMCDPHSASRSSLSSSSSLRAVRSWPVQFVLLVLLSCSLVVLLLASDASSPVWPPPIRSCNTRSLYYARFLVILKASFTINTALRCAQPSVEFCTLLQATLNRRSVRPPVRPPVRPLG